jgi:hypothetical protein
MPATRKTRAQQKAVKETTNKEEDTTNEEEEDVLPPRRGRATRSTQKLTSKNEKKVADEDEEDEENESDKESDETSQDRTRTRRTRRGKMDKEASAGKSDDDEKEDAESEQPENPSNKSTKKVGKQKSAPAKRSRTPTKDISETESVEAPPETRKTRVSRRTSLASKEETVKKDTTNSEDDVEEKEDNKTEKSGVESENESSSRVTRASRSKTRKGQVTEEKVGANKEEAKEKPTRSAAEGENTDEAANREGKPEPTTTTRPKAKTAASKRKSVDKKQVEEEASKKQKSTKQLKLSDFLKPKADGNVEKAGNENPRGEVEDSKSDTDRSSQKSQEGIQETKHEKEIGSDILPTDKQNDALGDDASIEDKVENSQLKKEQKVDDVEIRRARLIPDEKDQTAEMGTVDVKVDEDAIGLEHNSGSVTTTTLEANESNLAGKNSDGVVIEEEAKVTEDMDHSSAAGVEDSLKIEMPDEMIDVDGIDHSSPAGVEDSSKIKMPDEMIEVDGMGMEDVTVKGTARDNGGTMDVDDECCSDKKDYAGESNEGTNVILPSKDNKESSSQDDKIIEKDEASEKTGAVRHADGGEKAKNPFNEKPKIHNAQQKPLDREDKMDFEATTLAGDIGATSAGTKMTDGLFHAGGNAIVANPTAASDIENDRSAEFSNEYKNDSKSSELIQTGGDSVVVPESVDAGVPAIGETRDDLIHNVDISQQEPSGFRATTLTHASHGTENMTLSESTDKEVFRAIASADQPSATIHVGVSGLSETATVPVELAPELAVSTTECATLGQSTAAQDTYETTDNQVSFKQSETDATGVGNKRIAGSDDEELNSVCQKRQKVDDEDASSEVGEPKRYLNLRCIKMRLFSTGIRAHGQVGYEKLFRNYWNAIALYLDSRLPMNYSKACKKVIDQFLRTKSLRRLHNKLILGKYSATVYSSSTTES